MAKRGKLRVFDVECSVGNESSRHIVAATNAKTARKYIQCLPSASGCIVTAEKIKGLKFTAKDAVAVYLRKSE